MKKLKLNGHQPASADPEQVMQESINVRTAATKTDFPVSGNGNPKAAL